MHSTHITHHLILLIDYSYSTNEKLFWEDSLWAYNVWVQTQKIFGAIPLNVVYIWGNNHWTKLCLRFLKKIAVLMSTLYAATSQNGQTHSNNSSANCLSMFDHFVGLVLKGLRSIFYFYYQIHRKQKCNIGQHLKKYLPFWNSLTNQ